MLYIPTVRKKKESVYKEQQAQLLHVRKTVATAGQICELDEVSGAAQDSQRAAGTFTGAEGCWPFAPAAGG